MQEYLRGAFEMHVHTAPDVQPRKCTDLELAQRFAEAGLGGGIVKCHYEDTTARAAMLNDLFPGLKFFGGVTLNNSVGGLNPKAVEVCGKMGGKIVWFPTMDALHYKSFHKKNKPETDLSDGITVFDEKGELKVEAVAVLEMAKKYNLLVGTGHLGADEAMALVKKGSEIGCQMILTHADNPATFVTIEQQCEAIAMGAVVEHCYFTTYYNRTSLEDVIAQIRGVGVENVYLGTDFGQTGSPYADEGLSEYALLLEEHGFTPDELRSMFHDLPAKLLGITE